MPKTTEQNLNIRKARRDEIVLSALKVFCEKGYDATTINDIVKKAGCSHGLFYHYFKTKREIFDEIVSVKRGIISESIAKEIKNTESYLEKLRIIINRTFHELKNDENYAYYFYFFITQKYQKSAKGIQASPNKKKSLDIGRFSFREFFKKGQEEGYFSTKYTYDELTRLFLSILSGTTLAYVISPKEIQKKMELLNIDLIIDVFGKETEHEKT